MHSKDCYDEVSSSSPVHDLLRPADLPAAAMQMPVVAAFAVLSTLRAWDSRARQRRHLAEMDERMLRDMGIDRVDAMREARKPFWRR